MSIKLKLIKQCDVNSNNYNTSNFNYDSPCKFNDNNIIIDRNFYNIIMNSWLDDKLREKYNIIIGDNIKYESNPDYDENYRYFYSSYHDWFDAKNWFHVLEPNTSYCYKLTNQDIDKLILIGKKLLHDTNPNIDQEIKDLDNLINNINIGINNIKNYYDCGVFAKYGMSSTKQEYKPDELHDGIDVIKHLMKCRKIIAGLIESAYNNNYDHSILIKKWENDISEKNEFRVFIENNNIIGISQQSLYNVVQEMYSIWGKIPEQIYGSVTTLWNNIKGKLNEKYNYSTLVLDVWIDNKCVSHLVEMNPYGDWGPAGSSLYEWKTDPPNKDNLELRITTY